MFFSLESDPGKFFPPLTPIKQEDLDALRTAFKQFIADEKSRLERELIFLNDLPISDLASASKDLQGVLSAAAGSELTRLLGGAV